MNDPLAWAPAACTLPTAGQPLRVAEFDRLLADHLHAANRLDPRTLDLLLAAESRDVVQDLTARESQCCSFFSFDISEANSGEIRLRIGVPPAQVAVLDGLSDRLPR